MLNMKKMGFILVLSLMLFFSAACGKQEEQTGTAYQIYTLSTSETKVEVHEYQVQATENDEILDELLQCLSTTPEKLEYKVPFAMGFELLSAKITDSKIVLNVSMDYKKLPATTEVLVRAAIVRTLTQIPSIRYVEIEVAGNPLYDNAGEVVGPMTAELFIDNDGNEINTYDQVRVKLYFANADGDGLIGAYREKYYSTNIPLERFVVDELIAGPSGQVEGLCASINPEVKVISILTKDQVCYVNLDSAFLTGVNNVSTEVSIYSIVNSLVELNGVNKVQILVNGEVPSSFSNATFERNLELVVNREK